MKARKITTYLAFYATLASCSKEVDTAFVVVSEEYKLKVTEVADSIDVPFGMSFLSSENLLVTDRTRKKMYRININEHKKYLVKGLPFVTDTTMAGEEGLLDVVVHPMFETNNILFFSYGLLQDSASTLVVAKGVLRNDSIHDRQILFTAMPWYKEPNHFGNRLAYKDGHLFISMGDRYFLRDSAQSLSNHLGKILRIREDGSVPNDNPFVQTRGARPEIWSYGHRNPQGLIIEKSSGQLWEHEHGPKGGDEVNRITKGKNYGWPVICYGIDYDGKPIGKGITESEGMEQPFHYYTPSIAPSGMEFYSGKMFPKWKSNLFIGAMALKHLNRLVVNKDKVMHEERIFKDQKWRVRNVKEAPDGALFIAVDGGKIFRVTAN